MSDPARDAEQAPNPLPRLVFRRRHRISHDRDYKAAYAHKLRKSRGVLTVYLHPTDHAEPRLGLSVGRRVGRAHERARLKRLIREAFRHLAPTIPAPPSGGAYDVVVAARGRGLDSMGECQEVLGDLIQRAHREQVRRDERGPRGDRV